MLTRHMLILRIDHVTLALKPTYSCVTKLVRFADCKHRGNLNFLLPNIEMWTFWNLDHWQYPQIKRSMRED